LVQQVPRDNRRSPPHFKLFASGTFYAVLHPGKRTNCSFMKTPTPGASPDGLIQYLNTHNSILTDQGINVQAFIERLTAFKSGSGSPLPPSSPPKSKSRRKSKANL